MELVLLGSAFGVLCAVIAPGRGRSSGGWFLLGLLFSFFALIALLALPKLDISPPAEKTGYKSKVCPACAETVKDAARVCRFCGHQFNDGRSTPKLPPHGEPNDATKHPSVIYESRHKGWRVKQLRDGTIAANTLSGWRRFTSISDLEASSD